MAMIRKGHAHNIEGCDLRPQASFIAGIFETAS
jgi:hypothetical protein